MMTFEQMLLGILDLQIQAGPPAEAWYRKIRIRSL